MHQKDKNKAIIATIVLILIVLVYYFLGKEVAKYAALAGFALWLGVLYFSNKGKQ